MDKRVLIIDDDKWVVMSTQMVLEAEGYEVKTALNGPEGIEIAKNYRPTAILLDILMPGIDGWETLDRLRESEATRETPVIIFTARESSPAQDTARFGDPTNLKYLRKPFRPEALVELVDAQIEQTTTQEVS